MRATKPGQSALLLLDVIDVLDALQVPYAIIGALAASFYGVVRGSADADAVVSSSGHAGLKTLIEALHRAGFKSVGQKGDVGDPIGAIIHVSDRFENRVDLLMRIRGMTEAAFARTVEAEFMQARVRVIGVEDLIAMKLFAGSPKDLDDVSGILRVSSSRVHLPLLKTLIHPYGKETALKLQSLLRQAR